MTWQRLGTRYDRKMLKRPGERRFSPRSPDGLTPPAMFAFQFRDALARILWRKLSEFAQFFTQFSFGLSVQPWVSSRFSE